MCSSFDLLPTFLLYDTPNAIMPLTPVLCHHQKPKSPGHLWLLDPTYCSGLPLNSRKLLSLSIYPNPFIGICGLSSADSPVLLIFSQNGPLTFLP